MKKTTLSTLLAALLLGANGCTKDTGPSVDALCAPTSSYAQPATNLEGVVGFNQTLQRYVVSRHVPGTYDSIDIGVVCGELPDYFKSVGAKVIFSGIYRGYGQAPPAAPAGTTYYYLEISKIAKL